MISLGKTLRTAVDLVRLEVLQHAPLGLLDRLREDLKGNETLSHVVRGRLVHRGDSAPLRRTRVELWSHGALGMGRYLADTTTDGDGTFEIFYSRLEACASGAWGLQLRVYDLPQRYLHQGAWEERRVLVEKLDGGDSGERRVALYEYEPPARAPFPYTTHDSLPRGFLPGTARRFLGSVSQFGAIHDELVLSLLVKSPTTDEIQALYPETLTLQMERRSPGSSRTDAYLGDRLLNGFHPAQLKVDPERAGRYFVSCDFRRFNLVGELDLPNFRVALELDAEGRLLPVEITLQYRKDGAHEAGAELLPPRTFHPGDAGWELSKRAARTVYFGILGQLYGHVATAHFNMEQYAIAMNRNLRRSPMRALLFPHLQETSNINDAGRSLLLDPTTGLFARAKQVAFADQLVWLRSNVGRLDWAGWKPRAPISPRHRYARAGNLYWEAIGEFLDGWFVANGAEILRTMDEIVAFNDDLIAHSVPFVERGMEEADDGLSWLDRNEVAAPHAGRASRGGEVLAVTPIVTRGQRPEDLLENLKQLGRYCIYHTTFTHSWYHLEQNNEFGEIRYAAMLTNTAPLWDRLTRETGDAGGDASILPDAEMQSTGLRVTHTLNGFDWGFLTRNEDGDLPQALIDAVVKRRAELAAAGLDIDGLRARLSS